MCRGLAYVHVHRDSEGIPGGSAISFTTTAPSAGGYRFFLDFKKQDTVHTAAFTFPLNHRFPGPLGRHCATGSSNVGEPGNTHHPRRGAPALNACSPEHSITKL